METKSYYPKSPSNVNPNYSSLPSSYKLKALLAILSIILFFILYFGLVVALGYLCKWAFTYNMGSLNKLTILGKAGAVAGSIMLFVFTLKFIFKLKNHKPENRIKIDKNKHPRLSEFIHKICKETGAPLPKSVYIDPDVNAYVSYSNSWLSLIFPVKKDLTIGLGLVSCLNLSEFKAVVSHEFGHFAQSTMKVGSYIMSANTIIHNMIFERDRWDDFLENWKASDIRISFAAWIITPIIWLIRQVLNLFYQFLNVMYSSLSREMEFNADKVAAKTSGSDAIISALWKLDDGSQNWTTTIDHLFNASKKEVFVENIYSHHQTVIDTHSLIQNELLNSLENHPSGGKQFFIGNELSKVSMYASHPPNNQREENVKKPYVDCVIDERSPWILFEEKEQLQENATQLIYKQYINVSPRNYSPAKVFETFIINETKGEKILEKYHNIFTDRFAYIPEKIDSSYTNKSSEELIIDIQIHESELTDLIAPLKLIEEKMQLAHHISQGTTKIKSFNIQGVDYNKKTAQEGYIKLMEAREEMYSTEFKNWDTKFFSSNIALSQKLGKGDIVNRILHQHQKISALFKFILGQKNGIIHTLEELQSRGDVQIVEINSLRNDIIASGKKMNDMIDKLKTLDFNPLSNIDNIDELIHTIRPHGNIPTPYGEMFENNTFNQFIQSVDQSLYQLQRIEQKNLSEILLSFENK